jgi:alpha-tubulin suppressor-like RCC1 family protein
MRNQAFSQNAIDYPRPRKPSSLPSLKALLFLVFAIGCSEGTKDPSPTEPVTVPKVAVITVFPPSDSLIVGFTQQFHATLQDGNGRPLEGRVVVWSTSDPLIATVNPTTGAARGIAAGKAMITASTEGLSGSAAVMVVPEGGPAGDFVDVVTGEAHTCGLTRNGTAYCWGLNLGSLGVGAHIEKTSMPLAVAGGHMFTSLTTKGFTTCGLTGEGAAYCWGANPEGQVGDGTTDSTGYRFVPTRVTGGVRFASISAGIFHTCGVSTAGVAYCWGHNGVAELGDGTYTNRLVPTPVATTLTFSSVSASYYHTCGVAVDGVGYCWGWNQFNQLGDVEGIGDIDPQSVRLRSVPSRIIGDREFTTIHSSRYFFTCGTVVSGSAYCWGYKGYGARGDGIIDGSGGPPVPVVGDHTFLSLSTGWHHTCGTTTTGAAYCWGLNEFGQLGDSSVTMRLTPTRIAGDENIAFTKISAGYQHTCGVTSRGAVYCWGWNNSGQLGDGTLTNRVAPTLVSQ